MAKEPLIKTTLHIQGEKALRIRRLKEIVGLNTDADILNHLINQGLSKEAPNFAAIEASKRMAEEIAGAFAVQFAQMGEQMKIQLED